MIEEHEKNVRAKNGRERQEPLDHTESGKVQSDVVWKLESNIDDSTGEVLSYCMDLLLDAGALDVSYLPIYMKKGRPAWQLNIICKEETREKLEEIVFRETSTIGIRRVRMERTILSRRFDTCEIVGQKVKRKITTLPDGSVKAAAEYESARRAAEQSGIPLRKILDEAEER
ncbi:MAG: nickel insertion protein [Eubacterium sp.]|nr:nickel insertion protein [Eubacterium sp.]